MLQVTRSFCSNPSRRVSPCHGETKGGKAQKGKAQQGKSKRHSEEAWRHPQEVNAKRRADGKDTRSTASISRSLRRAQQHHEAKAKPVPEPAKTRSRSPVRGVKSEAVEASSSSYEEAEAEPSQPSAAPKATGELLSRQGQQQPKEPRTSEAEGCRPRVSLSPRQSAQQRTQHKGSLSLAQANRQARQKVQLPQPARLVATKEIRQVSLSCQEPRRG